MSDFKSEINNYITSTFKFEDELLKGVLEEQKNAGGPMMNIGADQAKFISLLIQTSKSRNILELGSYFGYSSIWIGRALQDLKNLEANDELAYSLTCVEYSSKQAEIVKNNLDKAALAKIASVVNLDAKSYLAKLVEEKPLSLDMIFIDADKVNYPHYLEQAAKLLKPGAILLVDNVLGLHEYEVLEENTEEKRIKAIQEFNSQLANSDVFNGTILTVHAGLAMAVKN